MWNLNMQKLSVNENYPFPIKEGLSANFLSNAGNLIQLGLPGISSDELRSLKKGKIKCGLLINQPVILWLFDFGAGGQYDAPFDAKLYTREQLNLPNIENKEQRLLIEMHVVELHGLIVRALRAFTLPPELTIKFLSAVQDQISKPFDQKSYDETLNSIYKMPIDRLITKTKLYTAGE